MVESTQTSDGLLRNYIDDTTSFEDASASAMIAATGLYVSLHPPSHARSPHDLGECPHSTSPTHTRASPPPSSPPSRPKSTRPATSPKSSIPKTSPRRALTVQKARASSCSPTQRSISGGAMGHPGASDKSSGLGKSSGAERVFEVRWETVLGIVGVLLAGVLGLATI